MIVNLLAALWTGLLMALAMILSGLGLVYRIWSGLVPPLQFAILILIAWGLMNILWNRRHVFDGG